MTDIPRVTGEVPQTLEIEGDLDQLRAEGLVPLLIFAVDGRDWVRWIAPASVLPPDFGELVCPCCGGRALKWLDGAYLVDTPLEDVAGLL